MHGDYDNNLLPARRSAGHKRKSLVKIDEVSRKTRFASKIAMQLKTDQGTVKISAAGHGTEIRPGAEQLRFAHGRPGRLPRRKDPAYLGPFQLGKLIGDLATPSPRSCMGAPPRLFWGPPAGLERSKLTPEVPIPRALGFLISRAAGGYFPAHLRGTSENRW